jgi:hypothetical protein
MSESEEGEGTEDVVVDETAADAGADESSGSDAGDTGDEKSGKEEAKDDEEVKAEGDSKPGEFDTAAFEVPEGTEIDEAWMGKLTGNEAIQKLDQSEVQGLIGMVGEFVIAGENARVDAQNTQTEEWAKSFEKDPYVVEHGVDKVTPLALAARDEFFPEMEDIFTKTGLGSHPTMLVGMARIAESMHLLEGKLEGGGSAPGSGVKKSAAHTIFKEYAPGGKYA